VTPSMTVTDAVGVSRQGVCDGCVRTGVRKVMTVVTSVGRLRGPTVMTVTWERVSMMPRGSSATPSKGWFPLPGTHCEYHGLHIGVPGQRFHEQPDRSDRGKTGLTSQSCRKCPWDKRLALPMLIHCLEPVVSTRRKDGQAGVGLVQDTA